MSCGLAQQLDLGAGLEGESKEVRGELEGREQGGASGGSGLSEGLEVAAVPGNLIGGES